MQKKTFIRFDKIEYLNMKCLIWNQVLMLLDPIELYGSLKELNNFQLFH